MERMSTWALETCEHWLAGAETPMPCSQG
jgi:hypothetical protein